MDLQAMGQRIRSQREALQYSRDQMAERLGCTNKFCADIENGRKELSVRQLLELSKFLDLSVDYLLGLGAMPDIVFKDLTEDQNSCIQRVANQMMILNHQIRILHK